MIRLAALTLVLAVSAGSAWAAERVPSFPAQTDYDQARQSLRAIGWRPVEAGARQSCAPGFEDRCRRYPEAEVCRGTGLASCEMVWARGETIIEVRTTGEDDPPTVSGVKCRLNCPSAARR